MSSSLDMSLDDIIKSNKNSGAVAPKFRGRGRGSRGTGPSRRFNNRAFARPAPYAQAVQAPMSTWDHGMFPVQAGSYLAPAAGGGASGTGTKLYVSNLDYAVSNEDIKELFSEVGNLKQYGIHYDKSGKSKGTADIVFSRREEALEAIKRFNNVELDGKPMKIEIVGTNILSLSPVQPVANNGTFQNRNSGFNRGGGRGRTAGWAQGGGQRLGRGRGRGRGQGRGRAQNLSAEVLDADLEKYHKEAMQTD